MKKLLLVVIALTCSTISFAEENCYPMMNAANDPGKSYNQSACQCIWTNTYTGCMAHQPIPALCGKSLFNKLKVADDNSINNLYCIHDSDKQGCIDSLDYLREPGHGTGTKYTAHNCPCTDAHCQ